MNQQSMKKRVHIFYSGRVVGVGFRLTAEETARQFRVTGWVKNLRDGRVELIAEGEETILTRFLEAIRLGPMKNFIQKEDVSRSDASGTFEEFEIRH